MSLYMWKYVLFYTDNSLVSTYFTLIGGVAMTPKSKMVAVILFVVVGFLGVVAGALLPQYLTQKMEEKRISPPQDSDEGWEEKSWTVIHMAKDRPGWVEVRRGNKNGDAYAITPYAAQQYGEQSILVPVPTEWRWQMPLPGQKVVVRTKYGETPVFVRTDHATRIVGTEWSDEEYNNAPYKMRVLVKEVCTDPLTGISQVLVVEDGEYYKDRDTRGNVEIRPVLNGPYRTIKARTLDEKAFWVGTERGFGQVKVSPGQYAYIKRWYSDWPANGQQFRGYILMD